MIDLRGTLGSPPIVFPGVRMQHPELPDGTPGNAPLMPIGARAQQSLGACVGCSAARNPTGIGDLVPWYSKIPLWAKIAAGLVLAGGVGYGIYRFVR